MSKVRDVALLIVQRLYRGSEGTWHTDFDRISDLPMRCLRHRGAWRWPPAFTRNFTSCRTQKAFSSIIFNATYRTHPEENCNGRVKILPDTTSHSALLKLWATIPAACQRPIFYSLVLSLASPNSPRSACSRTLFESHRTGKDPPVMEATGRWECREENV